MTLSQLFKALDLLREKGVTPPQFEVMYAISLHKPKNGRLNMTKLADKSGKSTAVVTGIMDSLISKGYAARINPSDEDDRREKTAVLTESGKAMIETLTKELSVN